MFSSETDDWSTPQYLFDQLNQEFHFTLDVCATKDNAKCSKYFTIEDNGLEKSWGNNICWMNPPYGREIGKWMNKAYEESKTGATVVCLVPSRTDTKWWWNTAMKVWPYGIRFIKGRLKFGNSETSAPFPSVIVVFNPVK